jgi:2-polyprenyl-3-methyl-5-hydroxy-6-metoxy-1,4-benzoquinol methylase
MSTRESYYRDWDAKYGMSHARRDRILALATGTGMRVLDVGCAAGGLGALIRERGNWVGGVELSEAGSRQAAERLDRVWSFDIEGEWPDELSRGDFDLVVMGEVVEHLFDPAAVLARAKTALKPGGRIIVTTPNFMTWTNRLKFLAGRFAYQEEGMFDFGHIRWFTHASLHRTLRDAGFMVDAERHVIFPGKLTALLKRWPSLFAWQFVVRARTT